jgi:hypothetical protein
MAARRMQEAKSAKEGFERTEMAARRMQMAKSATERILGTQWLLANSATKMLLLLGT